MRQKFESRLIFGVLFWIGIIAFSVILLRKTVSDTPRASGMLFDYVTKQRRLVEIEFPNEVVLSRGTPVFSSDPLQVNPIGVVSFVFRISRVSGQRIRRSVSDAQCSVSRSS